MKNKNGLHLLSAALLTAATGVAMAAPPADGTLDTTFSDDGKQRIHFDEPGTPGTDTVFDTVKDGAGRTYIVGTVSTADGERIGITRLDADGHIDNSFGPDGDGRVVAPDEMGFNLSGVAAAMSNDGFLLVAGTLNIEGNNDFAVCRLDSEGELAAFPGSQFSCKAVAFDLGGPGAQADVLSDVLVQSDGKIVLVGSATANLSPLFVEAAIARLNPDATLDETFNGTGKQYFLPVQQGNLVVTTVRLNSATIADNGKIVAVGSTQLEGFDDHDLCIVRLTADGELDTSFSGDGFRSYVDFDSSRDARFNSVALMPRLAPLQLVLDQEIVAVGKIEKVPGSGTYDGLLARMQATSAPDNGFSGDGFQIDSIGVSQSLEDVEPMYDHSITVVGTTTTQQATKLFYAARFLTDGVKDTAGFNSPLGYTTVGLDTGVNQDQGKAFVFHDKRIVMAGTIQRNLPGDFDYAAVGLVRDRIFHDGVERLD